MALCFTLSSCGIKQSKPETLNKLIDISLAEHQYDAIDDLFESLDSKNPAYKSVLKRKSSINKKKAAYVRQVSAKASKLQRKGQWHKALQVYDHAMQNIRNEPRLSKERKKLIKKRDHKVNLLRQQLLIQDATSQIALTKLYLRLQQLNPRELEQVIDLEALEKHRKEIRNKLKTCGEQATNEKAYEKAKTCFSLATQLTSVDDASKPPPEKAKNKPDSSTHKKAVSELLKSYHNAYNKQQYAEAKLHLETLLAINPRHKQARTKLKSLNNELRILIDEQITLGKKLYTQKKVEQALNVWLKAQSYAPNNAELEQLIKRAQRVSNKIERLEQKQ